MCCYTVFQCFTWPSQLSLEYTTTAIRISKIRHIVSVITKEVWVYSTDYATEDWSWTLVKIILIDQQRCKTMCLLWNQHVLYTPLPQKVTIRIAIENKRLDFGIMCNILIVSAGKKSDLLVRWFLYHSRYEWFINCS